jgi:hypothetical protein
MKFHFLLVSAALALPASLASAQITIEITEVPYTQPHAFLSVNFETAGAQNVIRASDKSEFLVPQTGFALSMFGAHDTNVQLEMAFAYRRLDLSSISGAQNIGLGSFHIGGRLYPRYPTFGLGSSIAVRVTGSALGGYAFDFGDSTVTAGNSGIVSGLDAQISAGLAFSGRSEPSGLTAEVVYRPTELSGQRFSVKPSWALRFGFLFGP